MEGILAGSNMVILALLLTPVIGAVLVTVTRQKRASEIITVSSAFLILVQVFFIISNVIQNKTITGFGGAFYIDSFGAIILLPISVVGFVSALYSVNYMGRQYDNGMVDMKHISRYYQAFNVFLLTMLVVPITNNVGIMWVMLEATTLISVLLIMLYFKQNAIEAAWKYLMIATVGLSFAFIGITFFYYVNSNATSAADAMNWTEMMHNAKLFDPGLVKIAFVFVLVGFGTKAGLAPLHTWLPDAHSEAPTPVSALLSGVLLNCAFYCIVRFHIISSSSVGQGFSSNLMIILAVVSAGIAAASIYFQKDMKRMLAFSSIEHMGIISLGIGFGGLLGIYGSLLQIVNHAIAKPMMFFASGTITQKYETKAMSRITGIIRTMPATGVLFLIGGLALVGMPPFNIFLSEFLILGDGIKSGQFLATSLVILFLVITFAVFLRHVVRMVFGNPSPQIQKSPVGKLAIIPVVILGSLVIVLGLYVPEQLQTLVHNATLVINNGGSA